MTLGFSTYGMKSLTTEDAIKAVGEIGYDAVELTVRADWDSAPGNLSPARRKDIKALLIDRDLKLTSFMEHIYPSADDKQHKESMDRLKGVFKMAVELSPAAPPVMQTVLGGGTWPIHRNRA